MKMLKSDSRLCGTNPSHLNVNGGGIYFKRVKQKTICGVKKIKL